MHANSSMMSDDVRYIDEGYRSSIALPIEVHHQAISIASCNIMQQETVVVVDASSSSSKGTDRYSDILMQRCISDSHYLVSKYIDAESIRCGACGVALGVYTRFVSNISIPNRFRIDASMMHRYQKNRYTLENSDPYP